MLKRPSKFKPKIAPRAPRPAPKPSAEKAASISNGTRNEPTPPDALSTPAITPLTTNSPTQAVLQESANISTSAPTPPTAPTSTRTPTPLAPSQNEKLVSTIPPQTISETQTPGEVSGRPSVAVPGSHLPLEAPAAPLPTIEPTVVTTSTQAKATKARSARSTRTPRAPRAPRTAKTTRSRRRGPSPNSEDRQDEDDEEPPRELTIQEAIAINTANKQAGVGQKKKSAATKSKRPVGTRKRKSKADGEDARPRKQRSRKKSREDGDGGGAIPRQRARASTPENAEEQVIDPQALTLADVTRDLRIGRKFSKHDELLEREKAKKQKQKEQRIARKVAEFNGEPLPDNSEAGRAEGDENISQTPGSRTETSANNNNAGEEEEEQQHQEAQVRPAGPRFEIVDGQLVVDHSTLHIDRHANTMNQDLPEVVEDDFSRLTNSNSHMPAGKITKNPWSDPETELFYTALRMFGTDFLTISKMFPHKNRRQVKLKFNREERVNPDGINNALVGIKETKIDIEMFQQHSKKELRSVQEIEAEHRLEMEEMQRKEDERMATVQEENRRKKEELMKRVDEEGKKKKKNSRKRNNNGDDNNNTYVGEGADMGAAGEVVAQEQGFGRVTGRVQAEKPAFGSRPRF